MHLKAQKDKRKKRSWNRTAQANGWAGCGDLGRDLHLRKRKKRLKLILHVIGSTMSL